MDQPSDHIWVATDEALAQIVAALETATEVVIDTEFHAERRYHPELMLLQLGLPDGSVALIDPRAVSLQPLAPILARLPWVVHGGRFDLVVLHDWLGILPPVLRDTQVLAGMLGHHFPSGLGALAKAVLGLEVDKGAALSDWSRRPLPQEQLRYAAADVHLTRQVWEGLAASADPQRIAWAEEEAWTMVVETRDPPDPGLGVLKWDVASRLAPTALHVLAGLYRWREERAQQTDSPPHYVLSDGIALGLARRMPKSRADLHANRRVPTGLVKRHGDDLVALIAALAAESPTPPPVPDLAQARLARACEVWADALEAQLGINARLLLPTPLARRVAMGAPLTGWRSEAAGRFFSAWMTGTGHVRIDEGNPCFESPPETA